LTVFFEDHPEPFRTATDYINYLTEQNSVHLHKQRNCVDDVDDARKKFTCRRLLQTVTSQFVSRQFDQGPFKLFCDDFRPGNILVDENLQITAVLDWEWCYAAPYQFLYSPPCWLLLKPPVDWRDDYMEDVDLLDRYMPKFELFVRVLEEQENKRIQRTGSLSSQSIDNRPPRMSTLMRQSMADGTFWFNEATRQSFSLDRLWWSRLNDLCSVSSDNENDHPAELLRSAAFQTDLEDFVRLKMEHLDQYNKECAGVGTMGAEIEQYAAVDGHKESRIVRPQLIVRAWNNSSY
jgi:hypothetical protein